MPHNTERRFNSFDIVRQRINCHIKQDATTEKKFDAQLFNVITAFAFFPSEISHTVMHFSFQKVIH